MASQDLVRLNQLQPRDHHATPVYHATFHHDAAPWRRGFARAAAMIHGIGVDMVEIRRIEEGIARFGARLARRILTDAELQIYDHNARPALFLAKRFAAKEATVKALGTGFRENVSMREIGVDNDHLGKPVLRYSSSLLQQLQQCGVVRSHISITDEGDYALAYVLLEAD